MSFRNFCHIVGHVGQKSTCLIIHSSVKCCHQTILWSSMEIKCKGSVLKNVNETDGTSGVRPDNGLELHHRVVTFAAGWIPTGGWRRRHEHSWKCTVQFTALKHIVFGVEAAQSLQTHLIVYNNTARKNRTSEASTLILKPAYYPQHKASSC